MKLLHWLIRPKQIKETLKTLEGLEPLFAGNFAFDAIKTRARSEIIQNPERVITSICTDGLAPREVCLIIVLNLVIDDLWRGRDHIYRGVLSNIGMDKKRLHLVALRELEKIGNCTPEDARQMRQELEEAIKGVG
jgi:hypothetical protein